MHKFAIIAVCSYYSLMLPVMFNTSTLRIALIGQGEKLRARHAKLQELGGANLKVFIYPEKANFKDFDIVLIVGLDDKTSKTLHVQAKAAYCLVNVEDKKEYCDFFFQSFVKRGKLLISVSTGGASPATAKLVRNKIAEAFKPEWSEYMDEIAAKRIEWKSSGLSYEEIDKRTTEHVKNWLS